jgi:hypothetical protein
MKRFVNRGILGAGMSAAGMTALASVLGAGVKWGFVADAVEYVMAGVKWLG